MNKIFESLLAKNANKEELEDLIEMALNAINEWQYFVNECNNKIDELNELLTGEDVDTP